MKRTVVCICAGALIGAMAATRTAHALCLDPNTLVSGYKMKLADEVASTALIVVGRVTEQRPLFEDPTDPDSITAYIYTVQVLRRLKGTAPHTVELRTDNDSGRYPMNVGEAHLLFLTRQDAYLMADSCGNSTLLPHGNSVLARVEALLTAAARAP
jgi:hypothetical protein